MNRYFLIRRLRGPAFLLLLGFIALLNQMHVLGWDQSWPLFLILAGVLILAERAALAASESYPQTPYTGAPYAGGPYPGPATGADPNSGAIVPAHTEFHNHDSNGGQ